MKTILIGVFAHPDDEAFGPSATLLRDADSGAELHLLSVTAGERGANPDNVPNLGAVRKMEWQAAGYMLGAASMHMLHFPDGGLCNNLYYEIAKQIETHIRQICDNNGPAQLRLMTYDVNGLTGHIDHITVSYIVTQVFYKLKTTLPDNLIVQELAYFCLTKKQVPQPNLNYFVFMPAGCEKSYITRQVDVTAFLSKKYAAMRLHKSQRADCEAMIARGKAFHQTDNFRVIR